MGLYQIKKWIKETGSYVVFLQVLGTVFFTGLWSFILFGFFLYVYTLYDNELAQLFVQKSMGMFPAAPSIIILFEGAGASIIVAFINMQYFRRYEEGEKSPRR
jgi:predicted membrane protein